MIGDLGQETHLDFYRRWQRLSRPYFAWQFDQFRPYLGRRVAEVGCGLGSFIPYLLDRDLYIGLEPDIELVNETRKNFGHYAMVEIVGGDVTQTNTRDFLQCRKIDTILCINVLEHIKDDRVALGIMADALPIGGHLCILVPALQWLFGTLDTLDGHYRRYTKKNLYLKLAELPLAVINMYYFNLIGAPAWFIKSRIFKERTHSDMNYTLMCRLLPLVSLVEGAFRPPIGMSLIAIARRR